MSSPAPSYEFCPTPLTASVGRIVKEFGLSADTWRRLADSGAVRALRIGGGHGTRAFVRESCYRYIETASAPRASGHVSTTGDSALRIHAAFIKRRQNSRED